MRRAPCHRAPSRRANRLHRSATEPERYTGSRWQYRMDAASNSIGDTAIDGDRLVVIERDTSQGDAARTKRVLVIDLA